MNTQKSGDIKYALSVDWNTTALVAPATERTLDERTTRNTISAKSAKKPV